MMLLQRILNGVERSNLTIVTDSATSNGSELFLVSVNQLAERCDVIHLFLFDNPPQEFTTSLLPRAHSKLIIHDYWSDPLGWLNPTAVKNLANFDFAEVVNNGVRQDKKMGVVLDSLTTLLRHCTVQKFCYSVQHLQKCVAANGSECTVIGKLHRDVCDGHIKKSLEHVFDTVVDVILEEELLDFVERKKKVTRPGKPISLCRLLHKKPTGKVVESVETFTLLRGNLVDAKPWAPKGQAADTMDSSAEELDPTANLTFNLSLSNEEKTARSKLVMPYTKPRHVEVKLDSAPVSAQPGYIYYEPDDADDFDEEDPDDDLDF